jgi:hypothetical protein
MRGEVQQPEPAAPSHEGMTTAVCVTASSANATMERLTTRGRWLGLSGHDYGRYAAILHLTVMIGIAFAQAHRTYGPAGRRTHVWGARIRVQTVLWHRSSRICPQVKDSQAWIARPFTKRLLSLWTAELSHCSDQGAVAARRRWPGVSARLSLGRPARRTPGHTREDTHKSATLTRHTYRFRTPASCLPTDCPSRGHSLKGRPFGRRTSLPRS